MKRQWIVLGSSIILFICLIGLFSPAYVHAATIPVSAEEENLSISGGAFTPDLSEVQSTLDKTLRGNKFSIENFVNQAAGGEQKLEPENIITDVFELFKDQWEAEKNQLIRLLFLGIIAGVFSNFSAALDKKELGETGFYIVFILLFGVMSVEFFKSFELAKETMEGLLDFMKVLVPAFSLSLVTVTGSTTSGAYYELNILAMTVIDSVLVKMVLPGTQIFFLLNLSNYLLKEARFTKLAELIETFLMWTLKTIFGAVVGFQGIQMLLYPMIDQVKQGVFWKTASGLPGVGNLFGTVAGTLFGTGLVIKSAIGVGGLIGICLICVLPMLKLFIFMVIFKISAALLQPISDGRIVSSMQIAARSGKLLLSVVACSALLFVLSIAIVLQATNRIV